VDRLFERDITVRVLSVIIALGLWFLVTAEQNPLTLRTFRTVEVKSQYLDKDLVLIDIEPKTIAVTVQSQRRTVDALKDGDIVAFVDLSSVLPGRAAVPIDIILPRGVQLVDASPNQVNVVADTISRRLVKVEVRAVGTPHEDFVAQPAEIEVQEVIVEGPRTNVGIVSRVVADVDISNATADIEREVSLRLLDIDGREVPDVRSQPEQVLVRVPMRKLPPSKIVRVEAETFGPPQLGYRVESLVAEPATVKIRGPLDVLIRVDSVGTTPVDVTGVASDFDRQVEVRMPPGVSSVEPKQVLVKVHIVEDRIEKQIENVPVTVRNLSADLNHSLEPSEISVVVEGPRELIDRMDSRYVEAIVYATGLGAGEHLLYVQVSLPPGAVLRRMSQESIKLILTTN